MGELPRLRLPGCDQLLEVLALLRRELDVILFLHGAPRRVHRRFVLSKIPHLVYTSQSKLDATLALDDFHNAMLDQPQEVPAYVIWAATVSPGQTVDLSAERDGVPVTLRLLDLMQRTLYHLQ